LHAETSIDQKKSEEFIRDYQEKVVRLIRSLIQKGAFFNNLKTWFSNKSENHANLVAVCSTLRTRKILRRLIGSVELAISRY
jgi:hypothetical protein